jgi:hypothetical protein
MRSARISGVREPTSTKDFEEIERSIIAKSRGRLSDVLVINSEREKP